MERLVVLVVVISFLSGPVFTFIDRKVCATSDCKTQCSSKMCAQICNFPSCKMHFNCTSANQECSVFCNKGNCPSMSCENTKKNGNCSLVCVGTHCNMKALSDTSSSFSCPQGNCDMECSNYNSVCTFFCYRNCNIKCKAKSCSYTCDNGNCNIIGGLGTKKITVPFAKNTKIICAKGSKCGDEGCDSKNNCVTYVANPLNETVPEIPEILTPTTIPQLSLGPSKVLPNNSKPVGYAKQFSKPLSSPDPTNKTVTKPRPVGAAEAFHVSFWTLIITLTCTAISL